uniref:RUN domain-containing protein n=1 Tax=Ascaris lumbricoides TaxID=6252 RepID=A0A0M3INQ6_ASCLU
MHVNDLSETRQACCRNPLKQQINALSMHGVRRSPSSPPEELGALISSDLLARFLTGLVAISKTVAKLNTVVVEIIANESVLSHFLSKSLINSDQYGFLLDRSMMPKAFNVVSHHKLLEELLGMGQMVRSSNGCGWWIVITEPFCVKRLSLRQCSGAAIFHHTY